MKTVLEYTTEEQRFCFLFCGQKDTMHWIFIKKYFLFTVGSVCRVKGFTTGSRNSLKDVRKSQVRKWLRQQFKTFLCCGFRRTGKAMGQAYQCWWRICREINVFVSRLEYHIFYVLYPFVTYLMTLPRKNKT
jgi:hypothetical protein